VIVVDTGAVLPLLDKSDRHHAAVRDLYEDRPDDWLLPWAMPSRSGLSGGFRAWSTRAGGISHRSGGRFIRGRIRQTDDVIRAQAISRKYRALRLGLVDAVVIAIAERVKADAIATLDLRHFGVEVAGSPRLLPRDAK
jgi:uncharacterized protein